MRLLVLSRYDRLGASSRLRMLQYLPWLESEGIDVTVAPFFSDGYVLGLQSRKRSLREIISAYFTRISTLLGRGGYDLIWIEKEVLPWLPAELELALLSRHTPYILEYDDAVFHYYDLHRNPIVKAVLGRKHPMLMSGARLVIAGNDYLATCARHLGAKRVEVIPTVIDLERYPDQIHLDKRIPLSSPCVGWIGQRITGEGSSHILVEAE
jgi:hypothetical protein